MFLHFEALKRLSQLSPYDTTGHVITHNVTQLHLLTACDKPHSMLAINMLDMAVIVYC